MSDESLNSEVVEATPTTENTAVSEVESEAPGEPEPPKTFTQEELDKTISKRLAQERRRWEREQQAQAEQPRSSEAPVPDEFKSTEEYIEALAAHKAREIIEQHEGRKRASEIEETYATREEAAREKYDDFEEVVQNPNLRITREMAHVIKASEIGPDVAYYLGSNPREADRISRLDPLSQAREIGKIEVSLSSNPAPVKKASSAPEPIKPVGSRSTPPVYKASDPRSSKTMSDSEWINARNRELRAQG